MKGGNVLLFQDRIHTEIQMMQSNPIKSNFFDLLDNYGIHFKTNLVADANCGQVQVQKKQGFFSFAVPVFYPFFPIVQNVNKENVIVKNLDNLQFIFASEIDTTRVKPNQKFENLVATSKNSGETSGPQFDINYEKYMNKNLKMMFKDAPKTIAGIYSGTFESYFAKKAQSKNPDFVPINENGKIIVVADGDFAQEGAGAGIPIQKK